MAELSQIEEFLKKELTPIHAKLVVLGENFKRLTTSQEYISAKYDQLLEQSKDTNAGLIKWAKAIQAKINSNKDMTIKTMGETEEMAKHLPRDCLEISGVKLNAELSRISVAHSLPSYKKDASQT